MLPLLAMSLASSRGSTAVGALHDADVEVMAACVPQRLWKGVAHKKEVRRRGRFEGGGAACNVVCPPCPQWIAAVTPECRALADRLETIEDVHAEYIGIVSVCCATPPMAWVAPAEHTSCLSGVARVRSIGDQRKPSQRRAGSAARRNHRRSAEL